MNIVHKFDDFVSFENNLFDLATFESFDDSVEVSVTEEVAPASPPSRVHLDRDNVQTVINFLQSWLDNQSPTV